MKALVLGCLLALTTVGSSTDQLWDNGTHDGRTGFLSYRGGGLYWMVDDFNVRAPWRITSASAEFYVELGSHKPFELADISIWKQPRPGKEPGDAVLELTDLPIEWEQVGEGFGFPIISARVTNTDISLPPGNYYFGMRLVADNEHGGRAWLCTTGNGSIQGWNGGWFWNNHPWRWEPAWWQFSYPLRARLATSDFAFALYGERG